MITTIDPTTEAVLERFSYMSAHEIDERLDRASRAQAAGLRTSLDDRAALLRRAGAALRTQREALAHAAVAEMGKPVVQARAEIEKCAWCCEWFADHAAAMLAQQDAPSNAAQSYVAFRPLGVLLAIMPWNFPYWQVFRAAVPALIAGNAVVLKHADNTTRCALEIDRLFREAGAPDGLFQTLLIDHHDVDERIADPRIAAVTLTGSERAGVAVAGAAGAALKKCVLELGGSDAFVVLDDADLELAAKTAVTARFQNNGQSCIAAKRFIAVDAVYERFTARFAELAAAQHLGDPRNDATQLGPCARGDLLKTLHDQVTATVEKGARLVTGGHPLDRPGYFYEPTVVADVEPGMRMFDEETFGPAAAVIRTKDAAHAVDLANASSFGLGASIFTADTANARSMAERIQAGMIFVNGMVSSDPRLPFGGIKRSGHGRELSHFGLHEFVNIQTVWVGPAA